MSVRTLAALTLIAAPSAAHATTCSYSGSAAAYVNCLAADLTTAMDDIVSMRSRLDTLEAEAVRSPQAITLSLGFLQYDEPLLTYTAPDGSTDSIDVGSMADGEVRFGGAGLLAVKDGLPGEDAVIYVNLDDVGSTTCAVLSDDDDVPRPGRYIATDTGGNVTVWGVDTHATLMVARQGEEELPMSHFEGIAFACF